jgi:hypothetical protein
MADIPVVSGEKPTEPVATSAAPAVSAVAASAPVEVKTDPSPKPVEPTAAKPVEPAKVAQAAKPVEPPVVDPKAAEAETARIAAEAKANAVPEQYELTGAQGALDPALIGAIAPVLKDAKVTAGQAQKLVDNFVAYQKQALPALMARDLETLKADPALGGLNFGRTQQRINDALAAFSTPEERSVLTSLGMANNPTLVRMFHRIGTAMQEPAQTDAGARARPARTTQAKLYGGADRKESGAPPRTQ